MLNGHFSRCTGPPCSCETKGYWYILLIAIVAASIEYWLALRFADSAAVRADAIHAFVHSFLYSIAVLISWIVKTFIVTIEQEPRIRAIGGIVNLTAICLGLLWIVFLEAIPKWQNPTSVDSGYMLLSSSAGLIGGSFMLYILEKKMKGEKSNETYLVSKLDVAGDLGLSVIVFSTSLIFFVIIYLNPGLASYSHYLNNWVDPILTIIAALWIIGIAIDIFLTKTLKNL